MIRKILGMPATTMCLALFSLSAAGQKANLEKVQIIAHRGASFHAPENTVASARLGWQHMADAVEIDIHLSADNKIMVIHDAGTKRTTGRDFKIASTTSDTLRTLDAGSWKSDVFRGHKIPFLKEVLEIVPADKKLVIEIKSNKALVPILKEEILKSGKMQQCMIISFDFEALVEARKAMPDIPVYFLSGKLTPDAFEELLPSIRENKFNGLNLSHVTITAEIAGLCQKHKLPLLAWTVDDPVLAKKLISMGVTAITTNKPQEMRKALQ